MEQEACMAVSAEDIRRIRAPEEGSRWSDCISGDDGE